MKFQGHTLVELPRHAWGQKAVTRYNTVSKMRYLSPFHAFIYIARNKNWPNSTNNNYVEIIVSLIWHKQDTAKLNK